VSREARVTSPSPGAVLTGPSTFAGYEILSEIGRGAAAVVYRVRRPRTGAEYALKVLEADDLVTAFRREAALMATIKHPGLPHIHEVGVVDGRTYLILDLVHGERLTDVLARGRLSPERAIALALDVVDPLTAVHRTGVVHRDIKPDNIMVQPDGTAQLIDFGLAARTTTGPAEAAVGTLTYCAPEQAGTLRRPVSRRSDLYSLGAVLFECIAGRPPFPTDDVGELLRLHAVAPVPDLDRLVPGTPKGLADVVATLLAKDPDDRYQSGEELLADLNQLADAPHRPISIRTEGGGAPPDHRMPLVGRAGELARLSRAWAAARGGEGAVCVVRGGAGAGKNRLASELVALATGSGSLVLRGRGSIDDAVPLAPLREALAACLREVDRLPEAVRTDVHARIRRSAGDAFPLLTGQAEARTGRHSRDDGQDRFTLAVVGFLTTLAREFGGLLLVLDEVQWLDTGTVRVLARLAEDLPTVPMLVLATGRDDPAGAARTDAVVAGAGSRVAADITLGPLTESGVAELVSILLPGVEVDARLVRLLNARGRGSPFVVQEYLSAIVDAGLLRPSWGTWILDEDGLDALELPDDALGLVLARVDGLGPGVRSMLTTAAVAGCRFRPDLVAAAHGVAASEVLAGLQEAAGRGLVEARPDGEYAFLHDRIREALLDGGTAELHVRMAEVLGTGHAFEAAHHYIAAGAAAPVDAAVAACVAAGHLALGTFAPAKAVALFEHVLDLTPTPDAEVLVALGTALRQTGQFGRAAATLERALHAERNAFARADILVALATVHRSVWNVDAARAAVAAGLAEMSAAPPRNRFALVLTSVLLFVAAVLRGGRGTVTGEKRRRCETIAALHEEGTYIAVLAMRRHEVLLHNLRVSYWLRRLGHGGQYARSLGTLAFVCANLGQRRLADRLFRRAAGDEGAADPVVRAVVAHYRGAAQYLTYRDDGEAWTHAIDEHGRSLDLAAYTDAVSVFAVDALACGRTREAARWWEIGRRRLTVSTGEPTSLFVVPAMLAAAGGRPADAAAELRRMSAGQSQHPNPGTAVRRALTDLFVLTEQDETGPPFDRAVAEFEALGHRRHHLIRPHRTGKYTIAMGRLAQARAAAPDNRAARLEQARVAVAALRETRRHPLQVARERVARADLLVLGGAPDRALRLLNRIPPNTGPDAPTLAYEAARIRARALRELGANDDSVRQALLAAAIAEHEGWPHRVAWITAEFPGTRRRRSPEPSAEVDSDDVDRQRLRALEEVSRAASRVLDPRELARIALDETIRILHADRAFLFLTTGDGERLVPHLGRDAAGNDLGELTAYSASLVERVRERREPLVVTGTDESAALGAQSAIQHGLRSIMVAPLRLEDRLLGVVYLDSQIAKGIFTANDAGILIALTNHVATSLETARAAQLEISVQTAHRQRDLAEQLRTAFEEMSDTLEPEKILVRLMRSARSLLQSDRAWLLSREADGRCVLTESGFYGETAREITADRTALALLARDEPAAGVDVGVPAAITDRLPDARGWLVLPLRSRTSEVGVLVLGSGDPTALDHQVEVASALVAQGLTAFDNASLFARVQNLAVVDELTGIANRRRFLEVAERDLAAAIRHSRPLSAMMIDIDHFKSVNDTYGHPTGDDVIREVASRLAAHARRTDLVGRYGGEEFSLVLPETGTLTCKELAERLRSAIADEPVQTRTGPLGVTVSIGTASRQPGDADLITLLSRADQALYEAKNAGRNRVA
jgi:diguanylate cyclase (GGDEF)-like protein